jgi:ParB family chromosome partitioning protein
MTKKTLRTTVSQMDNSSPLQGQPARDHAAMILPVSAIKLGENIRKELGNLEELAASITAHGILQPLVIAKTVHGLELVAGHRRLEAAKLAGLIEVPVRIVGADENQIAVLRLVENIVREDLSGAEEIIAVAKLSAMFQDQAQLAKAIGKSKSYVSRCLKGSQAAQQRELRRRNSGTVEIGTL